MASRSGKLVVAVVLTIGVGLGALGSWWLVRSRPVPGDYVDAIALPDGGAVVIRRERGSQRNFVEVHDRTRMRWRALVPTYNGAVGTVAVAATPSVVTVRVTRDGHPQVFAFDTVHGSKLDSFDLADGEPPDGHAYTLPGLATVASGEWSVEVVSRPGGGARLYALALDEHRVAWKVDVAGTPTAVWFGGGGQVRARVDGAELAWDLATGAVAAPRSAEPLGRADQGYVAGEVIGARGGSPWTFAVPATAVRPQLYHLAGGRAWVIEPTKLSLVDGPLGVTRTIPR